MFTQHEALALISVSPAQNELGVVTHTYKPRTWEVAAGAVRGSRSFQVHREVRPAWATRNPAPVCGSDICSDNLKRPDFPKSCDLQMSL